MKEDIRNEIRRLAAAAVMCAAMSRNAILSSEEMLLFENERKEGGEDE